jgi:hypothetical protein
MPIYCTFLIAVAVAATAISVWTRRYTLRLDFDRPTTLSLVVQCLALWLMCPFTTSCVGTLLHTITGWWNVDDLIGHVFLIAAVIASFMGIAVRLADANEVRAFVVQRILPPATIAISLMLMLFSLSRWPRLAQPVPSLLSIPGDGDRWMHGYFVVAIAIIGYIGQMALRTLVTLYRVAPGGRMTVTTYCAAYAVGALASAVQLGTMFVPAIRPLNPDGAFVWILLCGCVILSAIGSAWSWQRTLDPWRGLIKATGARL